MRKLTARASLCASVALAACPSPPAQIFPAPPTEVAGLQLWLDASKGISASPVAVWSDQSGNGRDFTAAGSQRPVTGTSMNGRNTVDFDGADNLLFGPALGTLVTRSEWTVFVTFRFVGSATDAVDVWLNPPIIADAGGFWGVFATSQHLWGYSWDVGMIASAVSASAGVSSYAYAQLDGASLRVSVNGSAASAVPCGNLVENALGFHVMLGYGFPTSVKFRGSLGDVAVWNRALTIEELERVELYFAQKYGL